MKKKPIIYQDIPLNYRVVGTGSAVMLLHGFGEDGSIWNDFIPALAANYRVIVPEIPGSGDSLFLPMEIPGLENYAHAIDAILQQEAINRFCFIGHSMGGYIALAFAQMFPQKLYGLGLFHSSAYADDENKKAIRRKGIDFIKENGAQAFLKTSIPGLFADTQKNNAAIQSLIQKASRFGPDALVQYYEAMMARPDRAALLKSAAFPLLFIIGRHDAAVPFEHSMQQIQLPEIAHISILHNSAHMGMLEEKEKSLGALVNFLQAIHV